MSTSLHWISWKSWSNWNEEGNTEQRANRSKGKVSRVTFIEVREGQGQIEKGQKGRGQKWWSDWDQTLILGSQRSSTAQWCGELWYPAVFPGTVRLTEVHWAITDGFPEPLTQSGSQTHQNLGVHSARKGHCKADRKKTYRYSWWTCCHRMLYLQVQKEIRQIQGCKCILERCTC